MDAFEAGLLPNGPRLKDSPEGHPLRDHLRRLHPKKGTQKTGHLAASTEGVTKAGGCPKRRLSKEG